MSIGNKGLGWIPDKYEDFNPWFLEQHKKYIQKYREKLLELMIISPDRKLYLKDWKELQDKINKEIKEEEDNL